MVSIEYTCLSEGNESLHVLRPTESGANDNQYVLIFEGARDWSVACMIGDWEFQSVTKCMSMAADYLADPNSPRSKTFSVGSRSHPGALRDDYWIGAELQMAKIAPTSGDMYGRLTIRLDPEAQQPFFRAVSWRGIDDRTFRIYRTDEELAQIGRLFQRLEDATFEPVFTSAENCWFIPNFLRVGINLEALALRACIRRCSEHIALECPDGFSKFWLDTIAELEVPDSALCPKCGGFFPRWTGDGWRKICLGCYRNKKPTSYTQAEIDVASIVKPWLTATAKGDEPA